MNCKDDTSDNKSLTFMVDRAQKFPEKITGRPNKSKKKSVVYMFKFKDPFLWLTCCNDGFNDRIK